MVHGRIEVGEIKLRRWSGVVGDIVRNDIGRQRVIIHVGLEKLRNRSLMWLQLKLHRLKPVREDYQSNEKVNFSSKQ